MQNVARDQRNVDSLIAVGWRVAIVWECEIGENVTSISEELANWLDSDEETYGV